MAGHCFEVAICLLFAQCCIFNGFYFPLFRFTDMYNNNNANVGAQPGGQQPAFPPQASPFGNPFYGASSGLIRGGLSAYGERILGSSSEYVQSNVRNFSASQTWFLLNSITL